jgi:Fic family protein
VVRTEQNWIGGSTPLDAEFVPPPHELLPELLEDLCAYMSEDAHPPLVQAALAHAQVEPLHPFADGNGRAGRALLQLVLRRRGLCRRFVPPISLVLATWSKRYVAALMGTRADEPAGGEAEVAGLETWIEVAAQAARVACEEAHAYEGRIEAWVAGWRERLTATPGAPRADAAVWALIEVLPAAPLITARTAADLTRRSGRAVDGAIAHLVEAGVLKQIGGRVRYRLYEAVGVFDLVTDAERALASPERDTRRSAPVRSVPARKGR